MSRSLSTEKLFRGKLSMLARWLPTSGPRTTFENWHGLFKPCSNRRQRGILRSRQIGQKHDADGVSSMAPFKDTFLRLLITL